MSAARPARPNARGLLRALLGRRYLLLERSYRRFLSVAHPRERRHRRINREFVRRHGLHVAAGPFEGMLYTEETVSRVRNLIPRLLGAFELELHEVLENALTASYERIVNVGAAEGYYAVGLALRCPSATVFAFDPDPAARRLCQGMARANGVESRVRIEPLCCHRLLSTLLPGRTLLVVDCEGCELSLLDVEAVPALRDAAAVVELHDFIRPGASEEILARFAPTHRTGIVLTGERDAARYPQLGHLTRGEAAAALSEGRPPGMRWAVLTPRSGDAAAPA